MRFYVPAAASYATWLTSGPSVWNRPAIDRAFAMNREHPPVAKYVMGLGWLAFYQWTGLTSEVTACRLPIVMLWAWTVMLLFAWVRREASQLAALACCGCFILLPRLLFDAHAETLDFAVTAFLVAAAESLRRAVVSPQWTSGHAHRGHACPGPRHQAQRAVRHRGRVSRLAAHRPTQASRPRRHRRAHSHRLGADRHASPRSSPS